MIIRKTFKFEGSHIVRNCSTERCKSNIHGHSFKVEILIKADGLDNGQMILDFSLVKEIAGDFLDSFDHTYLFWNKEPDHFKEFIKQYSERWISLPISSSAESLALIIFYIIDKLLKNVQFGNNEKMPTLYSVIVHETETGYAQAFYEDLTMLPKLKGLEKDIEFSDQIKWEWQNSKWFLDLINEKKIILDEVKQQIK